MVAVFSVFMTLKRRNYEVGVLRTGLKQCKARNSSCFFSFCGFVLTCLVFILFLSGFSCCFNAKVLTLSI